MGGELVTKKKIGGRAGKKKWSKQSNTDQLQLHELKQTQKNARDLSNKKIEKKPKSAGFKIQIEPDQAMKKRLEKDRFKAKKYELTSKSEIKKARAAEKSLKVLEKEKEIKKEIPKHSDPSTDFDLWGEDLRILHPKPQVKTLKELEVPTIVTPHAGQSYNPAVDAQLNLMEQIVEQAEEKPRIFKTKSEKAEERDLKALKAGNLAKRAPKPRSEKERKMMEEHQKQRDKKKAALEAKNFEFELNRLKKEEKKHGRL